MIGCGRSERALNGEATYELSTYLLSRGGGDLLFPGADTLSMGLRSNGHPRYGKAAQADQNVFRHIASLTATEDE
jgi:hypothetical protein